MKLASHSTLAALARAALLAGLALASPVLLAQPSEQATSDALAAPEVTAQSLIEGALDLTRGVTSYAEMAMTIHRPDWERRLELVAWTRGREDALIRFTAPAKDAGLATLKRGERMWTFTPKLKREIRLPSSMMSQSWAGSDFSYNDLSRTDNYLRHYDFAIVATEQDGDHLVYTLELTPRDDAPVVWGRETMVLRDDYVMLSQTFYDQGTDADGDGVIASSEMQPVKRMRTIEVGELGGRTIPVAMRMADVEEQDRWTEMRYLNADFNATVDDSMFTAFALRGER